MAVAAKICGISSTDALDAALDGGAQYVGLVFFPRSPRNVTPDQAAALAARVPADVTVVGLLVDPDDATLADIAAKSRIDLWQLHGRETPDRVARIKHDRAGSSGKTLLELDNRNEIFLKYILEKSSVALSLFPTNRNSVGQEQIYSVTGGTVAFLNNGQDHNVSSWSDLFESSVSNICGKSKHFCAKYVL